MIASNSHTNHELAMIADVLDRVKYQADTDQVQAEISVGELRAICQAALRPSVLGGPADAVTPAMLQEACDIGLAVAGSLATDGDGAWLQRNEARLRELEQIARRSATDRSAG